MVTYIEQQQLRCSGGPTEISRILHSKTMMEIQVELAKTASEKQELGDQSSNHSGEQGSNSAITFPAPRL